MTLSSLSAAPAVDAQVCDCEACTVLRDGIQGPGSTLPASIRHDDGSPVTIDVAGQTITVAEARLRLALADLPSDDALVRKIQTAIAELRRTDEVAYGLRFDRAEALLGTLA